MKILYYRIEQEFMMNNNFQAMGGFLTDLSIFAIIVREQP